MSGSSRKDNRVDLGTNQHNQFDHTHTSTPAEQSFRPTRLRQKVAPRSCYELHFTNYAPLPIELTGIEVLRGGGTTLASYRGQELEKAVIPVE
jgi:hypothetical protein